MKEQETFTERFWISRISDNRSIPRNMMNMQWNGSIYHVRSVMRGRLFMHYGTIYFTLQWIMNLHGICRPITYMDWLINVFLLDRDVLDIDIVRFVHLILISNNSSFCLSGLYAISHTLSVISGYIITPDSSFKLFHYVDSTFPVDKNKQKFAFDIVPNTYWLVVWKRHDRLIDSWRFASLIISSIHTGMLNLMTFENRISQSARDGWFLDKFEVSW